MRSKASQDGTYINTASGAATSSERTHRRRFTGSHPSAIRNAATMKIVVMRLPMASENSTPAGRLRPRR